MTLSVFLARVFGLYLIIVGFFYLFRRSFLLKAAMEFYELNALVVVTGVINLILGLLIVVGHNVWEWNWNLTITLLGYLILIKGVTRLFLPLDSEKKWTLKLVKKDNPIYIGIISLILGFFLTYEGFFGGAG